MSVAPEGSAIFDERSTSISIEDEAAGEFLVIKQASGEIRIDPDEWPTIRDAINKMAKRIIQ